MQVNDALGSRGTAALRGASELPLACALGIADGTVGSHCIAPHHSTDALQTHHKRDRIMSDGFVSRGFRGRPRAPASGRVPPGQYETTDFPVLSAGPTPRVPLAEWSFTVVGCTDAPASTGADDRLDRREAARWTWDAFRALPSESVTKDIHCVTKWSKLDTKWEGVSLDFLLAAAEAAGVARAAHVIAFCDGGYTTNLPLADVTGGKAWIVFDYDGAPLAPEHGGPARLLVPHLYFWKSAKWVRGLALCDADRPGFWESLGYHNYGDPWKEQRYNGD